MATTVTYRNFDVNNISFGTPKVSKDNNKNINIHYINGNVQYIQTPKDIIPFDPYDSNFCFSVNDKFKDKILEIEEYIIKKAVENSVLWFGEQRTEKEIRSTYVSILHQTSMDYPPFMRVNYTKNNEIYDIDKQLTDKNTIKARTYVRLIIKLGKVHIRGRDNQMKIMIYLEQAKIFEKQDNNSKLTSYAFIDDE